MGELITTPKGKPTLVVESDKRKDYELEYNVNNDFKVINEND